MQYIDFSEITSKHRNFNKFYRYPVKNSDLGICIVKILERFPRNNVAKLSDCRFVGHLIQGVLNVWIDEVEFKMRVHDAVIIESGENFKFEGYGIMMIISEPDFFEDHLTVCEYVDRFELSYRKLNEERQKSQVEETYNPNKVYVYDLGERKKDVENR